MRHTRSAVFTLCLVALLHPPATSAQTPQPAPATTFADLALRLPAESFVIVTDSKGARTTGKLIGIERDALSIQTYRATTFAQSDVQQVQRKLPDSVLNGGFIGLAIGTVGPLIVCTSNTDSSETVGCAISAVGFGGLPGFAIGAIVDKLRGRTVTLFRR